MRWHFWGTIGGISLTALGAGLALKSFLPQSLLNGRERAHIVEETPLDCSGFPSVEVSFLRCGSISVPEAVVTRGSFSFAPYSISHSAMLIRHPQATFLYDTGLCQTIHSFLAEQPFLFRRTMARFKLEQPLGAHLHQHGLQSKDVDFVLLSHLHWDHVSGVPDLPGVTLRVNRLEHDALHLGFFGSQLGLIQQLMGDNPVDIFDCDGPPYEGFRASLDLFGDGSIVLVPLPGHTPGSTGMFINRRNGSRLFLLGDAAWVSANYSIPTTMHPLLWSRVTCDDATARQTLIDLHYFALQHPEIPMIAMHDAPMQESFQRIEQANMVLTR